MANAVLIHNGFPVRLSAPNSYLIEDPQYSEMGLLMTFNLKVGADTIPFIYFDKYDFKPEDQKSGESGYYQKDSFYSYKKDEGLTRVMLEEGTTSQGYGHKFPIWGYDAEPKWGFAHAKEGDEVKVVCLSPDPPFTDYYMNKEYAFKARIDPESVEGIIKKYPSVNDFPPVNTNPLSPDYSIVTPHPTDLISGPTGIFYSKNFGNFVESWSISENEIATKKALSITVTEICFKIAQIVKEIGKFSVTHLDPLHNIYKLKFQQNDSSSYNELTLADRIVGDLMWQWGYYYDNSNTINKFDLTPILPTIYDSNYETELLHYYNALRNFYNNIYYKEAWELFPNDSTGTIEQRSDQRVMMLIKLLPAIAINVIPLEFRLEYLDKIIEGGKLKDDKERAVNESDVIRILGSFNGATEANALLNFMVKIKTGDKTRYELLNTLMDDKRISRYPFLFWVDEANNRQFFNFLLYKNWLISDYNMYYVTNQQTNTIESILNGNSYFLKPKANGGGMEYFNKEAATAADPDEVPMILESTFEVLSSSDYHSYNIDISYEADHIEKECIIINRIKRDTHFNAFSEHNSGTITSTSEYGKYHIYQPITLIKYDGNLDFGIPQSVPIPAFLYYYSCDYQWLKMLDATISFGIEVGIEVGLFFLTGGAAALRHLKYLKYVNKLGKAYNGLLSAQEAVVVWRGFEAGTQLVSVSAGALASTSNLIANSTTNQDTHDLMQKVGWFFIGLSLISGGGSYYGSRRVMRSANEIVEEVEALTAANKAHGLSIEVLDAVYTIRNTANVSQTLFNNRIASLLESELGELNHIASLYSGVSKSEKIMFWNHFGKNIDDIDFWKLMNKTEDGFPALRMKIWAEVTEDAAAKILRKNIEYLNDFVVFRYNFDEANWRHISQMTLKGGKEYLGGHTIDNTIKASEQGAASVIDEKWIIIDEIPTSSPEAVSQNIDNLTIIQPHPAGHMKLLEKTFFYRYSNIVHNGYPDEYLLHGQKIKKCPTNKTIINPLWSEKKIIQEHTYAIFNRKLKTRHNLGIRPNMGKSYDQIEYVFRSKFSDGTPIEITFRNYEKLGNTVIDNHYYIEIQGF